MADAFGTITCIGAFTGDIEAVVSALNRFVWNQDHVPFIIDGGVIAIDPIVSYPMIFPLKKIVYDQNNDEVDDLHPAYNGKLPDGWYTEDGDEVELEEIVKIVSPLLKSGEIIISMAASMKSFSVESGKLVINSNGTGTCHYEYTDAKGRKKNHTDHYP